MAEKPNLQVCLRPPIAVDHTEFAHDSVIHICLQFVICHFMFLIYFWSAVFVVFRMPSSRRILVRFGTLRFIK